MRVIEFREALREAMSEEMRRDDSVFLMGEEVMIFCLLTQSYRIRAWDPNASLWTYSYVSSSGGPAAPARS